MVPIEVGEPFERIGIDCLGPLPQTYDGNRFIVVITDYFTKYVEAFSVPDIKAETIANILVECIVCRHGAPKVLMSDRGTNFLSEIIQNVCERLGITKATSTAYHPQTQGLVERWNRTVENMLKMYTSANQRDWDRFLPFAVFAYNTAVQESTRESPFYLVFGRDPHLPLADDLHPPHNYDYVDYRHALSLRIKTAREIALSNIKRSQRKQKEIYDRTVNEFPISVGDRVWLKQPVIPKGKSAKLYHKWQGPYRALDVRLPNVTIRLNSNPRAKQKVVHVNHLKPCYDYGPLFVDAFQPIEQEENNDFPTKSLNNYDESELEPEVFDFNQNSEQIPDKGAPEVQPRYNLRSRTK